MNSTNINLASLLLRVSLGVMFIAHGLLKVMVFSMAGTAQFFEQVGFAGWMAYPVTFVEIIAGALLIVGFYSRYVALVTIPVLLGALYVHIGNGWVFSAANGGWEYPAFLVIAAIVVALLGDGEYSIRNLFSKNKQLVNA
ncbi:MAG: DoxX family protein [Thioalkalispiraceae bacterium]|jgi:putative oxidoreductase